MIVIKLKGGLGNQMFQYALGRSLSLKHNTSLFFDITELSDKNKKHTPRNFELNNFKIKALFSSNDFTTYKNPFYRIIAGILNLFLKKKRLQSIVEKQFHYDSSVISTPDNSCLNGYWNSPKYFNEHTDILRKDFSFNFNPTEKNSEIAEKIKSSCSVSLHIRRGDYVTNPETNTYHGTCDTDYYNKAVNIILEKNKNAVFYIFTDDPAWVSKNFRINADFFLASSINNLNGLEDMYLMTLCKHAIIANSTYSWWAAWLINNQDKTVIAPLKWFNDKSIDTIDLFPNSWIKI